MNIDLLKAIFSATFWSTIFLAFVFYRKREVSGAKYLSLLMVCSVFWTAGVLQGFVTNSLKLKEISLAIISIGAVFVPSLTLAFAFEYTGLKRYITPKFMLLINIFPLIVLAFAFIPSTRHFLWELELIGPHNNMALIKYKNFYYFWVIYAYGIYCYAIIHLFRGIRSKNNYYKRHNYIFIIAFILPLLSHVNVIFLRRMDFYIDTTPIGFALSATVLFFGIYNFRVFSLLPVAREKIIETISDAVLVTDKYHRLVMHNEAFRDYFNLGKSSLMGKYLDNVFPSLADFVQSEQANNHASYLEFNHETKTYDVTLKNITSPSNELVGKVIVLHDITHRKAIFEKLNMSNQHLQEQLANNESLIEDLKAFGYTVAHNLKTPLNTLIGRSDLLIEKLEGEKEKAAELHSIIESGVKMASIIDELLLFSQVSVKEVVIGPVDMGKVVESALERNREEIIRSNALIEKPENWPIVAAYAPWLEEVWINLISNALKYGGSQPKLTFGSGKKGRNEIYFSLQDNGPGLSTEQISQLFVPFNSGSINKPNSHGLGLAIVKRIIQKFNGNVWVTSDHKPGKGAVFYFSLPIKG
jgi:PAS domain S-box-containing protein